jgi:hypothetical protein
MKTAEIGVRKVATPRVIRHVFLVEHDIVAKTMKRAQDRPVWRGVAISPGRGDGESENRELQSLSPAPKGTYLFQMAIGSSPLP